MLAGIFEGFRNMSLKIYELDPAHFLTVTRLTWQVCLKKTKVELKILTDADIFFRHGWKRYQGWDMPCCIPICESQ